MGRSRETINAAVLAAAIGIDGAIKTDVGGVVSRDDLACSIERDRGLERRQFFKALPAIVKRNPSLGLKAAAGVRLRAAPASSFAINRDPKFRKVRRRTRRFGGRLDRRVLERVGGCSA